jgi:hypothetical protein
MASRCPLLTIEIAPGDALLAMEQLDGALLIPAAARPVIERALLLAQQSLTPAQSDEFDALSHAMQLLGIEPVVDTGEQALLANLLVVRPI